MYPSLYDEGGVCYVGMGSVNTAEQRMSYTANLLYAQAPPNTSSYGI